jgi:hypothetical protein
MHLNIRARVGAAEDRDSDSAFAFSILKTIPRNSRYSRNSVRRAFCEFCEFCEPMCKAVEPCPSSRCLVRQNPSRDCMTASGPGLGLFSRITRISRTHSENQVGVRDLCRVAQQVLLSG